ncbi:MAG: hypothetical protein ABR608_02700 [Pseudonocardiaceae bacterium]
MVPPPDGPSPDAPSSEATDLPTKVNDVRISDNGVVEWFDGVGWKPYRELPGSTTHDPIISLVFRGSGNGDDRDA